MHLRDAATELGVSEADLLVLYAGDSVVWLQPHWEKILRQLPRLGKVRAQTRCQNAVMEATLDYPTPNFGHQNVEFRSADFYFTSDLSRWRYGFAVEEETHKGTLHGLQFFDASGDAVHKLTLLPHDKPPPEYLDIIRQFRAPIQPENLAVQAQASTLNLEQRLASLKKAQAELVTPYSLRPFLEHIARLTSPLTITIENQASSQSRTAVVRGTKTKGPWLYFDCEASTIRVRFNQFGSAFVVEKRFLVFDKTGEPVFSISLPENSPASSTWNEILGAIPRL